MCGGYVGEVVGAHTWCGGGGGSLTIVLWKMA